MNHIDETRLGQHREHLAAHGKTHDLRRLRELAHDQVDHTWLWALSPHEGPALDAIDHREAIRIRFGIAGPTDAVDCKL